MESESGMKDSSTKYRLGKVPEIPSPNFIMNPAELRQFIPEGTAFEIKRIYWITKPTAEKKSSQHAHTDEDELFIVLQGNCSVILDDNGEGKVKKPVQANDIIWIPRLVWHGYEDLSDDAIVLALTSTNYDPDRKGYINDHKEFAEKVKEVNG